MLKIVNAFLKDHRKELGLKGYSKMSYLQKLKYLEEKTKGTKYQREISKLTKPKVDEGIKAILQKSGRGKNVRVKKEKKVKPPVKPKKTTTTQALQEMPLDIGSKISEEIAKQKPPTIEEVMDEVKKVLKNIKPNTDLVKARTKIRGLLREEKNKKSIRSYAFKISIDRIEKIIDSPKLSQKQINAITMAKNTITNWRSFYNSKSMMGS